MSLPLIIVLLVIGFVIGTLVILAKSSRGAQGADLVDGRLRSCNQPQNCVCSESDSIDANRIDPISASSGHQSLTVEQLSSLLISDGAKIVTQSENYIAATYASKFFGFVDDVELRIDTQVNLIHVRSASRVGRRDFGANRSRVERLRQKITTQGAPSSMRG